MKKLNLLLPFILIAICSKGQHIAPNATWCYYFESFYQFSYTHNVYTGDTLINSLPTKIINATTRHYEYDQNMIVHQTGLSTKKFYYRESNDTVWEYYNGQFYIDYIFNALPGDSWPTANNSSNINCANAYMHVIDTTSTNYNGVHYPGLKLRKIACGQGWPVYNSGEETVYYQLGPQHVSFSPNNWPLVDSTITYCASEYFISHYDSYNPMPGEQGGYCKFNAVGIDENSVLPVLTLYPNPANDRLYITTGQTNGSQTLQIVNSLGQIVYLKTTRNGIIDIDITTLPQGVYTLTSEYHNRRAVKHFCVIR